MQHTSKKCLILSQGPVPTPEHTKVEGGGLRCWGLAKGIKANNTDLKITVAYHESYRSDSFTQEYESIELKTWTLENLAELIQGYDTIIVSYCMGDLSVAVADNVRPDQQLILDCYVPIYIEVSARDSNEVDREYYAFHNDVGRWAHVLRRGDLFLCASNSQKKYYMGVLSAVGRINPVTYNQDLILITPYGIYRDDKPVATAKPISSLVKNDKVKKILWFGGIYPWFDLRNLVEAVAKVNNVTPARLVIVGAKNPFNTHPDFLQRYEELVEFINSKDEYKDLVIIQDWVKFDERANWYLDSDIVVLVNKLGEENKLAWRTRLVDFMWANLPVITNGGDPLGEQLLKSNAAARITSLEPSSMASEISKILGNPSKLADIQKNLAKLKKDYYWDVVTKDIATAIEKNKRSADMERYGQLDIIPEPAGLRGRITRIRGKLRKVPSYAKKHGVRNTAYAVKTTLGKKVAIISKKQRSPKVLFFAHQLDLSGAPFVLLDALTELKNTNPKLPLEFHTFNPAHKDNILRLNKMGIKPKLHITKDITFDFVNGDVIVLNTVAHSPSLKNSIYTALENNKANRLIWYVHEDEPDLIFGAPEKKRIQALLKANKLIIFIAAQQTAKHYQSFFKNTANIRIQDHNLVIPTKYHKTRRAEDFNELKFLLPGTVGDGRKGQLPIFYAFGAFKEFYYDKNPKAYRKFKLTYVGISDDFLSRQITKQAVRTLGSHFVSVGHVSHDKCLELDLASNFTICYSIRECLPLFVFEGMIAGHPILRNDSSGMEEQLREGENGYLLDSEDFSQVINTIEKVLNRKKTSNEVLAKMSAVSYKIAKDLEKKSYKPIVEEIINSYNH